MSWRGFDNASVRKLFDDNFRHASTRFRMRCNGSPSDDSWSCSLVSSYCCSQPQRLPSGEDGNRWKASLGNKANLPLTRHPTQITPHQRRCHPTTGRARLRLLTCKPSRARAMICLRLVLHEKVQYKQRFSGLVSHLSPPSTHLASSPFFFPFGYCAFCDR